MNSKNPKFTCSSGYHSGLLTRMLLLILALAFTALLPMGGLTFAQAQDGFSESDNPRSSFWREVRKGSEGISTVTGQEANVLIQNGGQNWRQIREKILTPMAFWAIGFVFVASILYHLVHGKIKLEGGLSGRKLPRFTMNQRLTHWFIACLFIFEAISGLILLLGREYLIPLFGKDGFSLLASAAKEGHNLFGPIFAFALIMLFINFVRGNFFDTDSDVRWIKRAGGLFGGGHVDGIRCYNFGEKIWFWLAIIGGTVISVSGLVLDFAVLGTERWGMQVAQIAHVVAAVALISALIGHIYIGVWGTEGSLEGMATGEVDENWGKLHHDIWAEEKQTELQAKPLTVLSRAEKITGQAPAPTTPEPTQ